MQPCILRTLQLMYHMRLVDSCYMSRPHVSLLTTS